ncbi:hypothetical protein BC830DRAFT_441263 [Chytriomyces sp. MP71]|nr:hypothetical protein BC830DRAFT_441263 [Chytriomyces sp. MP71]
MFFVSCANRGSCSLVISWVCSPTPKAIQNKGLQSHPRSNQTEQAPFIVSIGARNSHLLLAGLPARVQDWSIAEASAWIASNAEQGDAAAKLARDQRIDGRALLLLTPSDMENALKMTTVGDRLRFENKLNHLRALYMQQGEDGNTYTAAVESVGSSSTSLAIVQDPPAYKKV